MRPHNSGHWTIEGARTSQFEQHLRAVLDYPLGATEPTAPVVVMANVLGAATVPAMSVDERLHHLFARFPDVKVHLYGKAERPARKVGHVTVLGARRLDAVAGARRVAGRDTGSRTAEWTGRVDGHGMSRLGRRDHGQRLGLAGDVGGRGGARRVRRALRGGVVTPRTARRSGCSTTRVPPPGAGCG